jgi:hypothetical protein
VGHQLGEFGLAFVAHHALVAALEQEPVEAGQVVVELAEGARVWRSRHLELLAPAFGIQVEGVEKFVVGQHRQGGQLVGAWARIGGHDRLHPASPAPAGADGG